MIFVVAPDSFKGTLSSIQACQAIRAAALEVFPTCVQGQPNIQKCL